MVVHSRGVIELKQEALALFGHFHTLPGGGIAQGHIAFGDLHHQEERLHIHRFGRNRRFFTGKVRRRLGEILGRFLGRFPGGIFAGFFGGFPSRFLGGFFGRLLGRFFGRLLGRLFGRLLGRLFGRLLGRLFGRLLGGFFGRLLGRLCFIQCRYHRFLRCRGIGQPIGPGRLPELFQQAVIQAGGVPQPQDHCLLRAAAVIGFILGDLVISLQRHAPVRLCLLGGIRRLGHGLHIFDVSEFVFRSFQLQFQLFHRQAFPLQGQVIQCGIKGHKYIALFHRVAGLHQNFRDTLGIGEKYRLDTVRGDRSVALLGITPVLCHADILEGKNLYRFAVAVLQKIPTAQSAAGEQQRDHQYNGDHLTFGFTLHPGHLPSGMGWLRCGAHRRKCSSTCPHNRQLPAHG